jgi:hypothetical protein
MPIETDLNKLSANSQRIAAINAASQGMTAQEYITSRGGVNTTTGKYGDSVAATDLTDAQYLAAVAGKTGTDRGLAIGTATAQNVYNAAIAAIPPKSNTETQSAYDARVKKATDKAKSEQSGSVSNQTNAINAMLSGTTYTPPGGIGNNGLKSEEQIAAETAAAERQAKRQSAYDLLYSEFSQYGLASLVEPLKGLITSGASPAEFTIRLRESEPYKKRFSGNAQRISNGLAAIDEATYLATEDKYQALMRNYGLPSSYWSKDEMGTQQGFTDLIGNDVSAVELEGRLQTAQNRVVNANPEIAYALKEFYPDINNGDILAYVLDPKNGLDAINRKVTAAEIGGAAARSGLTTNVSDAEYLQRYGVTKETATQGYTTIASGLQRGSQLASIYGEDPYTQATAETEVFNVPGAQEARKQRQKITGLEKATFGGQSGISQGALARDRAGAY